MKASIGNIADVMQDSINTALKPKIFWAGLLLLCLLLSLLFSFFMPATNMYTLWFPTDYAGKHKAKAELRYIPVQKTIEAQAQALVEEILLGPMNTLARPLCYPNVRVKTALVSARSTKKTIYIDISGDIFFGKANNLELYSEPLLEPKEALSYIERALKWNFLFYKTVLTVNGLESSWATQIPSKKANTAKNN